MNKLFFSFIAIVSITAISCGNPSTNANSDSAKVEQQQVTVKNVQVADLKKAMDISEDANILDVRTTGEVAEGYVPSAINVDVKGNSFAQGVAGLDKSKTVYVYCRSGYRSQLASNQLLDLGFTDVRNVEGGFMAWQQSGFPVAK